MATWNSRGLRGSTLEELINRTNEKYRENGLALIQKIPTPITPMKIDKESRHITLAYFDQKSTVDYIGSVQEFPSVSMPRNVRWTRFLSKTSMRIRSLLCAILKSRRALLFPFILYTSGYIVLSDLPQIVGILEQSTGRRQKKLSSGRT